MEGVSQRCHYETEVHRDTVTPDEDFLFEVRESHLDTGLRGIPVGTCRTSSVDPIEGVHYVGIPVRETVDRAPAEVVYLLLHKRWPSNDELYTFLDHLDSVSHPPEAVGRVLKALGGNVHPMKALSIGIEILIDDEEGLEPLDEVMAIIARMPWLMAAIHRLRLNQRLPPFVPTQSPEVRVFDPFLPPSPKLSLLAQIDLPQLSVIIDRDPLIWGVLHVNVR